MAVQGALDHLLVLLYGTLLPNTGKVVGGRKKKSKSQAAHLDCIPITKVRACLTCLGINFKLLEEHTFKSDLKSNTL